MESPKSEPDQCARTVISKKGSMVRRSPPCKFNPLARKSVVKQPSMNSQLKPPKCFIKITGSRYNGTFLLNIDNGLDDAIYHTMRDIEVALEEQADPLGKPRVSPKNCLSSVFRCFGASESQAKAVCNKKKSQKPENKHAECSLTTTINESDLVPFMNLVQPESFNINPEESNESIVRDVVDVFRTTLDQICKESLDKFDEAPSKLLAETQTRQQPPPKNISMTKPVGKAEQSKADLKNVSVIKFSQDEVIVIQPPKLSNDDSKKLEVGIEIKPKSTASNVGQSIKLAKDKVLIGVQNGRGVLQIKDRLPKRSIQMLIEEGANGRPCVKLSVNERNPEQGNLSPECSDRMDGNENMEVNDILCTRTSSNLKMPHNNHRNKLKGYKSVESRVSSACSRDIGQPSVVQYNDKFKSESTQCDCAVIIESPAASMCTRCALVSDRQPADKNVGNEMAEESQVMVLDSPCFMKCSKTSKPWESRINRMPYLVHTLYQRRSLDNSSAYFASKKTSTHYNSVGKPSVPNRFETCKRQLKKPRSSTFSSSEYSSSSKYTKIFRDIEDICLSNTGPAYKKDEGTSMVEDFEKILKSMCGSSYLYHHPQVKSLSGTQHQSCPKVVQVAKPKMALDQWTQTDNCNRNVWVGLESTSKCQHKENVIQVGESGDGSRSKAFRKKGKRTKSNSTGILEDSSTSPSGLEDGLTSDSSESNNQLMFPVFEALDSKPLVTRSNQVVSKNCLNGSAKSSIGQKIFAALESPTNHQILLGGRRETDDCSVGQDVPKCLLPGISNVSIVNMVLCDGPTIVPLTDISEDSNDVNVIDPGTAVAPNIDTRKPPEFKEEWDCNRQLQQAIKTKPSFPIRVKSKSCQNLSLTLTGSKYMEKVENELVGRPKLKKLRHPQLTATRSHHESTLKVCGILKFNEGNIKFNEQFLNNGEPTPGLAQALPSAIRSLLLPRKRSLIFKSHEQQVPEFCCDHLASTEPADDGDSETSNPNCDHWTASNDAFESLQSVTHQKGIFRRTFFAMKTVRTAVTRKFSSIFQKLSFMHPEKRKKSLQLQDSLVYVAIPLEKKKENLHLYPGKP